MREKERLSVTAVPHCTQHGSRNRNQGKWWSYLPICHNCRALMIDMTPRRKRGETIECKSIASSVETEIERTKCDHSRFSSVAIFHFPLIVTHSGKHVRIVLAVTNWICWSPRRAFLWLVVPVGASHGHEPVSDVLQLPTTLPPCAGSLCTHLHSCPHKGPINQEQAPSPPK